jgi:hypothetical protein
MDFSSKASDLGKCCAYGHVSDGQAYLVDGLFPQVQHIPLAVGQDAASLLAQIEPGTQWFIWHVFVTYKGGIPHDREVLAAGLRERGILPINEGLLDASKRHTQAVLAQLGLPTTEAAAEGDPEEPLFFKSNYNFGGVAERRLSQQVRDYFAIRLPHRATPLFRNYNVYRRRQFKSQVFEIEDIFLERYVANEQHVFFRAFIAFDAVVLSRVVNKEVIKKAAHGEQRDDYFFSFEEAEAGFPSAPDDLVRRVMSDLHRFCRAFKLEMGGVDVLLDDTGTPYIIDANPTAYGGENLERPGIWQHLVDGLLQHAQKTASLVD